MLLSDLEDLEDLLESLVFEDEPSIFTDEYAVELVETAIYLMDEFISLNPHVMSEPNFQEILLEEIQDIFYIQFEEQIETLSNGDDIEDDLNELLEDAFKIFIQTFFQDDSTIIQEATIHDETDIQLIEDKIQKLRDIPQPVQRTPEWYQFRWNLITASNAWKALESQSTINQIIYEKCQPLKSDNDENEVKTVNVNSPLHWGQKYEPLTVLIYEFKFKTTVEDFGCIRHPNPNYYFLGASPDGIVVNKESDRFGRMLEIKNVVSRTINGIPKKEYWTQMQLQMEVCDLEECDFLETKFTEYPDNNTFLQDSQENDICLSKDGKMKGEIIYFIKSDGNPFYMYKPLDIINPSAIDEWENETIDIYENMPYNYTYMKTIYWKLEVFSCVLVLRNREWFKHNIIQLEKVWKIIEEERVTGYEHRAPIKKPRKDVSQCFINTESQGCLLKFDKIIKLDTEPNI
jgi:putative phage-type endonuclease